MEPTKEEIAKASRTYLDAKFEDFSGVMEDVPKEDSRGIELWTKYLGRMWSLPSDGRVDLSFQQHFLERLPKSDNEERLELLQSWLLTMREGNVAIKDFDLHGNVIDYRLSVEGKPTVSVEDEIIESRASGSSNMFFFTPVNDEQTTEQQELHGRNTSPWCRFM